MRLRGLLLGAFLGSVITAGGLLQAFRMGALQRPDSAVHGHADPGPAVDWARVSSRDLDIASLFITARTSGMRPAMDSLELLVRRNPALEPLAHPLAHGLGRFMAAEHPGDGSVFAACTPAFAAGCYHGVMEGYLSTPGAADHVEALCAGLGGNGQPRYAARECAHGLGHALMGIHGGRPEPSLRGCDRLAGDDDRQDCWEGVYMEDLIRAQGSAVVNVGDSSLARHARGHAARPQGRCDAVAVRYRAACWSYQPVAFMNAAKGDEASVLRGCRQAPDAAARWSCWAGYGKQTAGALRGRVDPLPARCSADGPEPVSACIDGVVEYLVERQWTAENAAAFCAAVPSAIGPACSESLGAHTALIHPDDASAVAACDRLSTAYAEHCRRGAASPRS
jgi:hypothetical protein